MSSHALHKVPGALGAGYLYAPMGAQMDWQQEGACQDMTWAFYPEQRRTLFGGAGQEDLLALPGAAGMPGLGAVSSRGIWRVGWNQRKGEKRDLEEAKISVTKDLPLRIARNIAFRHHPTLTACWIWTGQVHKVKGPIVSYPRGTPTTARSAVYRLLKGQSQRLKNLCGEDLCVNPHHMEVRS